MSNLFVFAVDENAQIPHRLERVAEHFDADRRRSLRHVRVLRVPQVRRVREGEHHPQSAPGRSVSRVLRSHKQFSRMSGSYGGYFAAHVVSP